MANNANFVAGETLTAVALDAAINGTVPAGTTLGASFLVNTGTAGVAGLGVVNPNYFTVTSSTLYLGNSSSSQTNNNLVLGPGATTSGTPSGTLVFGSTASSSGSNSVVIGNSGTATASDGVVLGQGANVSGLYGVAVGFTATASAQGAIAEGKAAHASGTNAVAVGITSSASGLSSAAVGDGATASAANAVAVGPTAEALNAGAVALGYGSGSWLQNQQTFGAFLNVRQGICLLTATGTTGTVQLTSNGAVAGGDNVLNLANAGNATFGFNSCAIGRLYVAMQNANGAGSALWEILLAYKYDSGTITVFNPGTTAAAPTYSDASLSTATVAVAADSTNHGVTITAVIPAAVTANVTGKIDLMAAG